MHGADLTGLPPQPAAASRPATARPIVDAGAREDRRGAAATTSGSGRSKRARLDRHRSFHRQAAQRETPPPEGDRDTAIGGADLGRGFGSDHLGPAPTVGRWRATEVGARGGELDHRLVVVKGERGPDRSARTTPSSAHSRRQRQSRGGHCLPRHLPILALPHGCTPSGSALSSFQLDLSRFGSAPSRL